jgi:tRNA(fMet)-specific endonuclease VapC
MKFTKKEKKTEGEMYLFDTDCISNLLKKTPSKKFIEKIGNLDKNDQYISTITVGELVYGAFKSNESQLFLEKIKNIILPAVNVLSFDISASFVYGKIRSELKREGIVISDADIQIASIAIANKLILITGNTRHFKNIKYLSVENWLI